MALPQPPPEVITLTPASVVHQDAISGHYSILSVLTNISPNQYPFRMPVMFIYMELTSGRGETPLQVRIIDVDEARPPVFDVSMTVQFSSPLFVLQGALKKHEVVFPEAGQYRIQLFSAGQLLKERRLFLLESPSA
jgi:hypothetical protein